MHRLSCRQARIMEMTACGMQNKEIAAELGMAESTVKNTMAAIYERLEARNRAHAVYRYIRETMKGNLDACRTGVGSHPGVDGIDRGQCGDVGSHT